jgi:hypothetical protein
MPLVPAIMTAIAIAIAIVVGERGAERDRRDSRRYRDRGHDLLRADSSLSRPQGRGHRGAA